MVTLKKAAKKLEEAGLIKRVSRPNRSNLCFINVALLQVQAESVKAIEEETRKAEQAGEISPFAVPMLDDASDSGPDDDSSDDEVLYAAATGGSR
jgi:hypothetical protein